MEKHNEQEGGQMNEDHTEAEGRVNSQAKVWVGSLSDYNAGRLYGAWIDAGGNLDDLEDRVQDMLKSSPTPGAEEYAIFDHEGFGPLPIDEYESLATVNRIARGIEEHGEAFAHYAAIIGSTDADQLDHFEDAYLGHFESVTAYAEDFLDDLGLLDALDSAVPETIAPYVHLDVESFASDLELSGSIMTSEDGDGVFVFDMERW